MTTRPPAEVGMPVAEIDTPALVVDLDAYEHNLDLMAATLRGTAVRLRGHAKTHKCPTVSLHEIARGAVGSCCQKVSEAEAMVDGASGTSSSRTRSSTGGRSSGSSPWPAGPRSSCASTIRGTSTTSRRRRTRPGCPWACWSRSTSATPAAASRPAGLRRAGPARRGPAEPPLRRPPGLLRARPAHQRGREAAGGDRDRHRGRAAHRRSPQAPGARLRARVGGGDGQLPLGSGERRLQRGAGRVLLLHGRRYNLVEGFPREFRQSLFVLAAVMSRPVPERAVVDAGLKALSVDKGMPGVHGLTGSSSSAPRTIR